MAWLVHEGKVLASLERADSIHRRTIGLLGRKEFDGALLLEKTRSVHTLGMKFPIDVAFCDRDLRVVRIITMGQHRISRVEFSASCAIETKAGRFRHWKVEVGDELEIRGDLSGVDQ
jgi:uncharacterized membrane protein (UPF0127 family)